MFVCQDEYYRTIKGVQIIKVPHVYDFNASRQPFNVKTPTAFIVQWARFLDKTTRFGDFIAISLKKFDCVLNVRLKNSAHLAHSNTCFVTFFLTVNVLVGFSSEYHLSDSFENVSLLEQAITVL